MFLTCFKLVPAFTGVGGANVQPDRKVPNSPRRAGGHRASGRRRGQRQRSDRRPQGWCRHRRGDARLESLF